MHGQSFTQSTIHDLIISKNNAKVLGKFSYRIFQTKQCKWANMKIFNLYLNFENFIESGIKNAQIQKSSTDF